VPITAFAGAHPLWDRPVWWSGLPGLALDLVLLDFGIYWWHRFNHEWKLLWRFHEVHHLDRVLDASSALRFHVGEVALSASVRAAAMIALAMPVSSVLVFETMLLLATIFHHSNLKLPTRFEQAISRAVITPEIHWVHHHAVRGDTDSNYGSFVTLWDILFGTRNRRPREPGMEIGVEGRDERTLPALIVLPFVRAPRRAG
jgi:sterol desaturase/sphingolipid hydroxylase (fatty acid hydroxylase superfamily)